MWIQTNSGETKAITNTGDSRSRNGRGKQTNTGEMKRLINTGGSRSHNMRMTTGVPDLELRSWSGAYLVCRENWLSAWKEFSEKVRMPKEMTRRKRK